MDRPRPGKTSLWIKVFPVLFLSKGSSVFCWGREAGTCYRADQLRSFGIQSSDIAIENNHWNFNIFIGIIWPVVWYNWMIFVCFVYLSTTRERQLLLCLILKSYHNVLVDMKATSNVDHNLVQFSKYRFTYTKWLFEMEWWWKNEGEVSWVNDTGLEDEGVFHLE